MTGGGPDTGRDADTVRTIGIAIQIPEPYGALLGRWRTSFGDPLAAGIPPHVTLLPPTEITDAVEPAIIAHLAAVAGRHRAFTIELRGTGTFRPVSPVVFVALARGISACERLERDVRSGPLARELSFPYHPHVTVAHELGTEVLDRAFTELADFHAVFTVPGFSCYVHGTDGVWRPHRDFTFPPGIAGAR